MALAELVEAITARPVKGKPTAEAFTTISPNW
jgi:hypothetical protein